MSRIISTHSYRGGTGKSNLTANLAVCLARRGRRVAIVDTDIQSPGVHILFGVEPADGLATLNDFLWGRCAIAEAAHDVTDRVVDGTGAPALEGAGRVFLIPASLNAGEIARIIKEGYEVEHLNDGLGAIVDELALDHLLIDTHPGLNEETLLSIAISDLLIVIMRPDRQDYQGSAVTLDVAQRLQVPRMLLVLNKVLPDADFPALKTEVAQAYRTEVAALIPLSEEMMRLGSAGIYTTIFPDDAVSREIEALADVVLS